VNVDCNTEWANHEAAIVRSYIGLGRLAVEVRRAARRRGIKSGDPLNFAAPMGSMNVELVAAELYLDLPNEVRSLNPDLASKMCKAVARTHASGGTPR